MDIFTTQLTRVVPVPIKPTEMKVKALLKEAATSKLKEDPDHLENHDYYFIKSNQEQAEQNKQQKHDVDHQDNSDIDDENVKHLDIFV